MGNSDEVLRTLMIESASSLLELEMISSNIVQKIKTHILCSLNFF